MIRHFLTKKRDNWHDIKFYLFMMAYMEPGSVSINKIYHMQTEESNVRDYPSLQNE